MTSCANHVQACAWQALVLRFDEDKGKALIDDVEARILAFGRALRQAKKLV